MKQFSVEEIIQGIRRRNNEIFKYLYKEIYPSVEAFIKNASGDEDDAKDIFQESLILLYRKVCEPKFSFQTSVKAYVFTICKNLWYQKNKLEGNKTDQLSVVEEKNAAYLATEDINLEEEELQSTLKKKLLQQYFRKLNRMCQRILQMFYKGKSHDEIANSFQVTVEVSRRRKKECMEKLIQTIMADPEYKKFYGTS